MDDIVSGLTSSTLSWPARIENYRRKIGVPYLATDCGFPALPGLRARPIRRRLRNCRVEAMALRRERDFYRSVGVRNHGANRAVKIRHRMPGLR